MFVWLVLGRVLLVEWSGMGFQAVIMFILLISNFLSQEKMKDEESSVQTAELVALERHKEKTALEENKREIERMEQWRFVH